MKTSTSGNNLKMASKAPRKPNRFANTSKMTEKNDESKSLLVLVKQALKSGQLNLSGRSMTTVPDFVWKLKADTNETETISFAGNSEAWWEYVELTKLNLSSNWLTEIPEDIREFSSLTVLDVHDNRLVKISEAIGSCTDLQRLYLSHNRLTDLPAAVWKLTKLTVLHLDNNSLSDIKDGIGKLNVLYDLSLSNNNLTSLTPSIGWLTCLSRLNVSQNQLQELPSEIGFITSLRFIDISKNQIRVVPESFENLRKLEQFFLHQNCLVKLPRLTHCASLKDIQLGNNCIEVIPTDDLLTYTSVSILDLRDNRISELPNEIGLLQSLERLTLSNNNISNLPYVLGSLPHLKTLQLEGNPLRSIRRDIIMRGTVELKKYLRSRMSESEIQKISAESHGNVLKPKENIEEDLVTINRHEVHQLKTFKYCGKQTPEIPKDIWAQVSEAYVFTVDISKNKLMQLPSGLKVTSKSLKDLNVGFNKLEKIGPEIGLYKHLVNLDLRNNYLSGLPQELIEVKSLREIVISFNRFESFPSVLYHMAKIENIFAADNKIESIDAERMANLKFLATLDLKNNNISVVPPELGNVTWLKCLELSGNGLRNPRPAILDKGTDAILQYLRNKIT